METRFGFMPVRSSLVNDLGLEAIIGEYARALTRLGGQRCSEVTGSAPWPVLYFVVSGGTENLVLEHHRQAVRRGLEEPVILMAHPGNNSLPAALEVLARLQQDGARGQIVYLGGPKDTPGLGRVTEAAANLSVWRELRRTRIGLFGDPSDWLVASKPTPEVVRGRWGPEVIPLALEELVQTMTLVHDAAEIEALVHALAAGASEIREASGEALEDGVRAYLALRLLIERHRLDALTVRCFDLVLHLRTTGCFALAQLNDEGIVAGCEGDLVSTVGLLWVQRLLGETAWMANPAQLEEASNSLWLAHCTVPRRMVSEYRLRSHFESGLGLGIQGTFTPGPVTLLRIGGRQMEKLWLAEGEILRSGDAPNLCRTQAEVRLERGGTVGDLLRVPLGNHIVLVPGHHLDRLQGWRRTVWGEAMD